MNLLSSLLQRRPERPPNECRATGAPGHVESYFLRLNHPTRPLALWLKATVFAPLAGDAVAESWLVWFDGERQATITHRERAPLRDATFSPRPGGGTDVHTPSLDLALAPSGSARGAFGLAPGEAGFELAWTRAEGLVGEPLSLFPWRLLREGPVPKLKLLTPFPWLTFSGTLRLPGGAVEVKDWLGMQGHNWGREHPFEYAWGQCLFPAAGDVPATMVEGFTARIRLAGITTPRLSALVVRQGGRSYRFDRLVDPWRQESTVTRDRWTVRLHGPDGEARLRMDAGGRPMACLGYGNPGGHISYCFNSKLADVLLEVRPRTGPAFTCRSAHGGALEFLRNEPDPRLPVV